MNTPTLQSSIIAVAETTQQTAEAFAKFSVAVKRKGRRRRSQQCRGSRARNYVRAVMRAAEHDDPEYARAVDAVVDDAEQSGALAAFREQQRRALSQERGR